MGTAKNSDIRKINRGLVFSAMFRSGKMTKAEIAAKTKLSIPTVSTVVGELLEMDLIQYQGLMKSDGGRRPIQLELNKNARFAVGIGITEHHVMGVLLNLEGHIIANSKNRIVFENTDTYWKQIVDCVRQLIREAQIAEEKLLTIGISISGMFRDDSSACMMLPPKMGSITINVNSIQEYFPWNICIYNDAHMMAVSEIWEHHDIQNATCLVMGQGIGGALIKDRHVDSELGFDRIGHMIIKSGGRRCSCGRRGCFEAYCSGDALERGSGYSIDRFFHELETGNTKCSAVWQEYLRYFAIGVSNIFLLTRTPMLITGRLSEQIAKYRDQLDQELEKYSAFERNITKYLEFQENDRYGSAKGAALLQISDFMPVPLS